jgi:hypothetical protein
MTITLDGTLGITSPTYGGAVTAEYSVPVTNFKNRIINGGMNTDQRNAAASQTFTAAAALAYSVDRWYGYCTGANVTGQKIAGGTTPTVTQNRYRFTGAASVTAVGFGQRIEQKNSYDLAGSTCTLSADLGISATLTTVTWTAYYATTTADTFGSLASPTVTSIATGTFTVGATVTNFSTNISIPAAATTGIQILFTVGALTSGLTWTIGNVQLEKGSTATSFDFRDYGRELAMCQRYYFRTTPVAGDRYAPGFNSSTIQGKFVSYYPVPMRIAPTAMETSGTATDYSIEIGGTVITANAVPSLNSNTINSASFQIAVASGLTANGGSFARSVTTNGYLGWSAEL